MKQKLTARNLAFLGALGAVIVLWSATRTWITVDVASGTVQIPQIVVDGASAAAATTALSIAVLAGSLALLIAGKISRYIIAAICLLAGIAIIAAGAATLADPQAAAFTAVSTATGLAQNAAQYSVSAWPAVAVAAGKTAVEPKDASSRNISSWEQLSDGEDPTADRR